MKKLYKLLGIIAIGAVIGLTVFGCKKDTDDDDDGGGPPGTLVITGVPEGTSVTSIGIIPAGTTGNADALEAARVAGSSSSHISSSGTTLTAKLYAKGTSERWTGSGPFDVYIVVSSSVYKVPNKTFSGGFATVASSDFEAVEE